MTEPIRGCGYRKVGGTYLVGSGLHVSCDSLPLVLHECPTCGFRPPKSRVFMWTRTRFWRLYAEDHHKDPKKPCKCLGMCPICFPPEEGKYGFMWVGKMYTPDSFVKEAKDMGVSKRIPKIPKDLEVGKTWILLAHRKVPIYSQMESNGMHLSEPPKKPAVFYAFRPERIEHLIWKKDATPERIQELEEKGYTPVLIDDKDPEAVKRHSPRGLRTHEST